MLDSLLSVLAPHICIQCGLEGAVWCEGCRRNAPPAAVRCYRCHRLSDGGKTCQTCRRASPLFAVAAATRYEDYAKRAIWKLKFGRAEDAASDLADVLLRRTSLPHDVLLVPAPTSTSRVRRRGYDQALLLTRQLARRASLAYLPALQRLGQLQQRNSSRRERLMQLEHAFEVVRAEQVQGKHVVLVDDVITTGATLEAAARALKAAGAKRVSAAVIAQA